MVHKPNSQGFQSRKRSASQENLKSRTFPDQPWKALCPSVPRNDAELHFRLAQRRVLRSDANSTSHGQFAAASQGKTIDSCNHRFAEMLNSIESRLSGQRIFSTVFSGSLGEFTDVSSSYERLLTGPGQYHDLNLTVLFCPLECTLQLFNCRAV